MNPCPCNYGTCLCLMKSKPTLTTDCGKVTLPPTPHTEPKAHKHAALIKAWADGARIQYKGTGSWQEVRTPYWADNVEYRVKPEPSKTTGYRRYILKDCEGKLVVAVLRQGRWALSHVEGVETAREFIRWIDTEWQYETVEVE